MIGNQIKLNNGFKLNLNKNEADNNKSNSGVVELNFANISSQNMDFQSEFLQHYDEFSPSWRKEVEKMKNRK